MDPGAFWQLNSSDQAEALALLPSVIELLIPFLVLNLIVLRKKPLAAILISIYAFGATLFWLIVTDCFYGLVDPVALLIAMFTPVVLVRVRLSFEDESLKSRAFWIGLAQMIPTLVVCLYASSFIPL